MMEEETDPKTSVRRVGTADRKTVLKPAGPLFAEESGEDGRAGTVRPSARPPTQSRRAVKNPRRAKNAGLYNIITLLFMLLTVGVLLYFAFLWENYTSPFNPFAPPTPLPIIVTATPGG